MLMNYATWAQLSRWNIFSTWMWKRTKGACLEFHPLKMLYLHLNWTPGGFPWRTGTFSCDDNKWKFRQFPWSKRGFHVCAAKSGITVNSSRMEWNAKLEIGKNPANSQEIWISKLNFIRPEDQLKYQLQELIRFPDITKTICACIWRNSHRTAACIAIMHFRWPLVAPSTNRIDKSLPQWRRLCGLWIIEKAKYVTLSYWIHNIPRWLLALVRPSLFHS